MNTDVFAERVRNKSTKKIWDPAGTRTQDLLNTSQTLLPLGPAFGYSYYRAARRTTPHDWAFKRLHSSARVPVQSISERVRVSWNSAEASRQCCSCSLSSAPLPRVQVA